MIFLSLGAHTFGRIVVGRSRWGRLMEMEGGAMGHHESMRTSWDGGISNQSFYGDMMGFYMLLYIYSPLYTDLYTWVNTQLDG